MAAVNEGERKKYLNKAIQQIDLESAKSVKDLVESFQGASIQARGIGQCAKVYENMLTDEDRPVIILGLSGALIAGGLRKVIRDLVKNNLVDVIASTGAVMYQDYYQARGYKHYAGDPAEDDVKLRELFIDRIYDTYVDEIKFDETDEHISRLIEKLPAGDYSSRQILSMLGKDANDENSILYQAYKNGVPVFSPALCDSSIGIGYVKYYSRHVKKSFRDRVTLDMIKDNYEIVKIIQKAKKTGAIYIGGGTPKNWVNDAVVMVSYITGQEFPGHTYIFQLTTDVPHWGGLSGSTLKEAQSWGKVSKKATKATAYVEATVSLPLVAGYIMQKPELYKNRKRLKFDWNGPDGLSIE